MGYSREHRFRTVDVLLALACLLALAGIATNVWATTHHPVPATRVVHTTRVIRITRTVYVQPVYRHTATRHVSLASVAAGRHTTVTALAKVSLGTHPGGLSARNAAALRSYLHHPHRVLPRGLVYLTAVGPASG